MNVTLGNASTLGMFKRYIENNKDMNRVGLQYGSWLGQMKWDYIATIRPHYRMTEFSSDKMMHNLSKYRYVDRLFFAIERDRDSTMNHIHLMLKADTTMSREGLAKSLRLNNKAVSYFQPVLSSKAVSNYCAKNISYSFSHHNFY